MKFQLVMKTDLKSPCKECPFRRDAARGWLGGYDGPEHFLAVHYHQCTPNPCHMSIDWEDGRTMEERLPDAQQCYGQLVMFENDCKSPRYWKPPIAVEPSPDVFTRPQEFVAHHQRPTEINGRRRAAR